MDNVLNFKKILFDLIKIESTQGKEIFIADYIENLFKDKGYKIIKQDITKNSSNILIFKGNPKLFFFGHLDTVGAGNLEQWKITGPWNPLELNNKIYGLGAIDMKAGISAVIAAVLEANPENIGICFTCDEEYSFLGVNKLVATNLLKDFKPELGIFCEPTNLKIMNAHRGCFEFKVRAIGKSAHASRPNEGIDASKLYLAIIKLREKLKNEFGNVDLNIGYFYSGHLDSINKIPEEAEAIVDIRPSSSLSLRGPEYILDSLKEILNKFEIKSFYEVHFNLKPLEVNKNELDDLVNVMESLHFPIEFDEMSGASESGEIHFNYKFPCANLGPGPKEMSHKSDEYVDLDSLKKCKNLYLKLINEYDK